MTQPPSRRDAGAAPSDGLPRWPERISQYDLVSLSPPDDPMQGFPLGNGDLGALVWCAPDALVIAINKCDLWDDAPEELDGLLNDPNLPYRTEEITSLRQACRVSFSLGMPLMDSWYLEDFEARLDLARATAHIRAVTPFGEFSARIFVSDEARSLVVEYDVTCEEGLSPSVTIERWGSRISPMYCGQLDRNPRHGLDGTETRVDGARLIVTQTLRKLRFAVAAELLDNGRAPEPRRLHQRGGVFVCGSGRRHRGTLLLSVAHSEETLEPVEEAVRRVGAARHRGTDVLEVAHVAWWEAFWRDACVWVNDALLENLWTLMLYYAGSSQRGRYPALFTQGLWGWNRDFQPWTHYFHWNQQQLTWPLCAAHHPELMKPYLDWRHRQLDGAKAAARRLGRPGARYGDISDRAGHQAEDRNHTPGGQIAADFWRYFRFTGDQEYLREKGWPVIEAAAQWHFGLLELGADDLYHTLPGTGYEGGNLLRDGTTDLVTTRRVLEIALETARELGIECREAPAWREALERLAPLVTMASPVNAGVRIFAAGLQKAVEPQAGRMPSGGFAEGDAAEWANPRPTCAHDPKRWGPIFSDVEISPVFPDGRIGLNDRGTPAFELAAATARESDMHWTRPIILARLGMRAELWQALRDFGGTWTSTGFPAAIPGYWETAAVADPRFAPDDYRTKPCGAAGADAWAAYEHSRAPLRLWEFRRIGQERPYVLATALNEALLQSHDGTIRVAPAMEDGRPFAFRLLAAGGFAISASGVGEHVSWVRVVSLRGGVCRLVNPWPDRESFRRDGGDGAWYARVGGAVLTFDMRAGEEVWLAEQPLANAAAPPAALAPQVNPGPRVSADGRLALGLPRMF